jgi:hypothetical protein
LPYPSRGRQAVPLRERLLSDEGRLSSIRRQRGSHHPRRRLHPRPRHLWSRHPRSRLHSWPRHSWHHFPWSCWHVSLGRLRLLLHSEAPRPSENQTEGKNGGTNPNHGFVEQPQFRRFAEFPAPAEQHAMLKLLGLKATDGQTVRSASAWPLRASESCSHIALPPGHRLFRTPAQAPHVGLQIQPPTRRGHDLSLLPRPVQGLSAASLR